MSNRFCGCLQASNHRTRITYTWCCMYSLRHLMMDDETSETHRVLFQNKINLRHRASGWFYYRNLVLIFGQDSNRYPPTLKYALRCSVCDVTSVKNISHVRLMIPFTNKLAIQSYRWNLVSEFWTSPVTLVWRASCLHPSRASYKIVNVCR